MRRRPVPALDKDEARGSNTCSAVSRTPANPSSWVLEGLTSPGRPHEGPKVFKLEGRFWMIADGWRGQAIYRPEDAAGGWTKQENLDGHILTAPETADGGPVVGRHADVVPLEASADGKERALIVYFTHPHWNGAATEGMAADPKTQTQPRPGRCTGDPRGQPGLHQRLTRTALRPAPPRPGTNVTAGTTKGRTAEL